MAVTQARFRNGRLFDMGGYPMLIEGGEGLVKGYMIKVPDGRYRLVMSRLDRLEGYDPSAPDSPGYRRQVQEIETAAGELQKVWVYVGQEYLVNGRPLVDKGDWSAYVNRQTIKARAWWEDVTTYFGLHGFDNKLIEDG